MTTIKLPAYVTLKNVSANAVKFAPYKENFNTTLGAGESLVLVAETAGQVFYYLKQANDAITVAQADTKAVGATYDVCATEAKPATVVVTNKAEVPMNFVPYRENFQFTVGKGEAYTFSATTAGQAIYYMNQGVEGQLDVAVTAAAEGK